MLMKRYSAPTLDEALAQMTRECGPDAMLVETRRSANGYVVVGGRQGEQKKRSGEPRKRTPKQEDGTDFRPSQFTRGFRSLAEHALGFGLHGAVLRAVEKALLGTRIQLQEPGDPALPGVAGKVLKALIPTTDSLPRVAALVGPTGVGKTTTLAKLAAQATRDEGQRVAIITTDTYRIAAVEQLRAFADMLQVPFEVAFTPQDLARAVQRHSGMDRVFIDTTGRGPFDRDAVAQLQGTLGTIGDPDFGSALCMPATSRRRDGMAILDRFLPLGCKQVILTKWDETEAPGEAMSLCMERGLPIARITVGQEVPEDIVPACAGTLAAAALDLDETTAARVAG